MKNKRRLAEASRRPFRAGRVDTPLYDTRLGTTNEKGEESMTQKIIRWLPVAALTGG